MKKALLILVALVIATAAYAVDASKMTDAGAKALLFSAGGFNAGSYNGGFGVKYYLSPGLALRPVLKFQYSSSTTKQDPDSSGTFANRTYTTYDDEKVSSTGFGLDLGIEKTMWSNGAVNVNLGAVAGFTMVSGTHDTGFKETYSAAGVPVANTSYTQTTKTESSSTNFGVAGLLNAEWFITESISLTGEYQLGLSMSSEGKDQSVTSATNVVGGVSTSASVTTKNPLTSTMGIGIGTAGLVLGIRF